jgi:putative transposase
MQFQTSIFCQLLKPVPRRAVETLSKRCGAGAYDKSFGCWDHLATMVFAQVAGIRSLRELATVWNAHSHHHYHIGSRRIARSTVADANVRRPAEVFAGVFTMLSGEAGRTLRQEGAEMVRLIDSSPIPLGEAVKWRTWNGRVKGVKMHVVYEPGLERPCRVDTTAATVNDIEIGKQVRIEPGCTYVFDKGYYCYKWWSEIDAGGAFFVTRLKQRARFRATRKRRLTGAGRQGDGCTILEDAEVKLVSKGDSRLAIPMRRIRIKRDSGGHLTLLTNDLTRPAAAIAKLYRTRWQIELLFRWIKQHLNVGTFLGRSENAVKLQILAAMIAYLLLRLAARASASAHTPIRFADLVACHLFVRKPMARIDKPPPVNPSSPKPKSSPDQLELTYA